MKINRISIIAALVVAVIAICSKPANAQEKKGKRGPSVEQQMERYTEALSLTDEQKPKVKAVLEESQKKRQEVFGDSSIPRDQMREKMRSIMEEQDKKLKDILKPDQFEKYQKMRAEMRGRGGQGGEKKKKEN